jgi:RNA polymerase sigma-70 factor (ECF subfamily)
VDKLENIERLYDEYGERVFNAVFCMLGRYQDAEDVTQEAFVSAHRRWDEFEGRSSPYTWLYRIAMNAAKTHLKRNSRRSKLLSDIGAGMHAGGATGAEDEVENRFLEDEAKREATAAMMRLPTKFREVVALRCVEGLSYGDISKILGVSIGTVESRLYRAKERLKKEMREISPKKDESHEEMQVSKARAILR